MAINQRCIVCAIAFIAAILVLPLTCSNTLAQTTIAFDPATKFTVPADNGVICFAEIGNYSKATFEDNAWFFTNLQINGSELLANLEFSAKNSNVTIYTYQTSTYGFANDRLTYMAQGEGQQVLNMGVGAQGGASVNWVVFSNSTFVSKGWSVSRNGTVTVNGLTGIVSVIYFGFTNDLGNANLPFYEQHSVAIAVTAAVAVTIAAAVVVKVGVKRRAGKGVGQ